MSLDQPEEIAIDGTGLRLGVVAARFNPRMVEGLLERCIEVWARAGVSPRDIEVLRVPGSNEVPFALTMLAKTLQYDALVGLGLVMAGETPHHEVIADSTGYAMQRIGIETETPVINGIVVVLNEEQAAARCLGAINRGREFGRAALEMAVLKREMVRRLDELDAEAENEGDGPWDGLSQKGNPWKL